MNNQDDIRAALCLVKQAYGTIKTPDGRTTKPTPEAQKIGDTIISCLEAQLVYNEEGQNVTQSNLYVTNDIQSKPVDLDELKREWFEVIVSKVSSRCDPGPISNWCDALIDHLAERGLLKTEGE